MTIVNEENLIELGGLLKDGGYRFVTISPHSHKQVLGRKLDVSGLDEVEILRQLFGWNREIPESRIPSKILKLLQQSGMVESGTSGTIRGAKKSGIKSKIRFSTIGGHILAHSSFPTDGQDAVFFGPDSYRFVRYLEQKKLTASKMIDIGCGTGVGAFALAKVCGHLCLTDINPVAVAFARINASLNGIRNAEFIEGDIVLSPSEQGGEPADLLVANPPFIMDPYDRSYRDGGDDFGLSVTLQMVTAALAHLPIAGQLVLYTGSCSVNGKDMLAERLQGLVPSNFAMEYEEIDPDIFGEELAEAAYAKVDRIAAIGLHLTRRS